MIKILHILSSTSLSRGDTAVVMNYYRNIDKTQCQYDFACLYNYSDNCDKEISDLGGHVFYAPSFGIFTTKKLIRFLKTLDLTRYDIIELHIPTIHSLVKKAIGVESKNKLIIHAHSTKLSDELLRKIRNKLLIVGINKNLLAKFACSKSAGVTFFGKSFGKKPNDILINNAVNIENFVFNKKIRDEYRKEFGFKKSDIIIGHVGRFENEKNHGKLISIANELHKINNNYKLIMCGDGSKKEYYKNEVDKLQAQEYIKFLGRRNDVNKILQAMDVFLLPSLFEGLSVCLVEAQTAGLLCFASNTCVKQSKITDNLFFIDLNTDSKIWAENIDTKLKNYNRKNETISVQTSHYDIKTEAKTLIGIYKGALNK